MSDAESASTNETMDEAQTAITTKCEPSLFITTCPDPEAISEVIATNNNLGDAVVQAIESKGESTSPLSAIEVDRVIHEAQSPPQEDTVDEILEQADELAPAPPADAEQEDQAIEAALPLSTADADRAIESPTEEGKVDDQVVNELVSTPPAVAEKLDNVYQAIESTDELLSTADIYRAIESPIEEGNVDEYEVVKASQDENEVVNASEDENEVVNASEDENEIVKASEAEDLVSTPPVGDDENKIELPVVEKLVDLAVEERMAGPDVGEKEAVPAAEEKQSENVRESVKAATPQETLKSEAKPLPVPIASVAQARKAHFEQVGSDNAKSAQGSEANYPKSTGKVIANPSLEWLTAQLNHVASNDPSLTELQLDDSHRLNFGPNQQEQLGKALASNTYLTKLTMANLNVGTPAALAIAESLKVNRTLESLNLEDNSIQPNGIKALADALRENSVLAELKVARQKHKQGAEAEVAFQNALQKNETLIKLTMVIQDKGCKNNIERYLTRNVEIARKKRFAKAKESAAAGTA
ncbi:hypothetical protein SeMB42_g02730 [Synchytrium endobioticum]|uniref:Uncharacterized protein n=1 Tax=Synchytrium endobioticum TaxID=286115 RepID=A0A507DCT5_9FUNG|nr:hypothetical protein SeMB42_g02730 [Synchytrium endobioticum]